jgi:hypothetical protein
MSNAARKQVELYMEPDSPEMQERQRWLAKVLLRKDPKLRQEILSESRLLDARSTLRRVFARRGLVLRPEDDARVDACTDLALLERWLDDAVVAKTASEVFSAKTPTPRATEKRRAR